MSHNRENITSVTEPVGGFARKKPFWGLICIALVALLGMVGCGDAIDVPQPQLPSNNIKLASPLIDLQVDFSELASDGVYVSIDARITNPNPVAVDIDNLEVAASGEKKSDKTQDTVPGGSIPPFSYRTFVPRLFIPRDLLNETTKIITFDATAKAADTTFSISATTPIELADANKLVNPPQIVLKVNIEQIDINGVNAKLEANFNNPNPMRLDTNVIEILVKNQQGTELKKCFMDGGSIEPGADALFTSNIILPRKTLNESSLKFDINTMAGFTPVNFPLAGATTFKFPKLSTIISVPQLTLDLESNWKNAFPTPDVELTYYASTEINTNQVALTIGERKFNVYKSDGTLLKSSSLGATTIPAGGDLKWYELVLLGEEIKGLYGTNVTVKIETEFGLSGVTAKIPASTSKLLLLRY